MIFLAVLGLVATVVWLNVMETSQDRPSAIKCAPPAHPPIPAPGQPAPKFGQALAADALDQTTPAPPGQTPVRVLNAGTRRGHAGLITETLKQAGFTQAAQPDSDPLYPAGDMTCRAQIRFGYQGMAAARTMSLLEPCAELVKDDRQDATVDLVIGDKFDELRPNTHAKKVLQQLSEWAAQHPATSGGLQAQQGRPGPRLDANLLAAARQVTC